MKNTRRLRAYLGIVDTPILHLRDPYIIAFWSVTFPGFGHLLLGKYYRGFLLVSWEFFINIYSKINTAMVYSFMGNFELAKEVLNVRLLHMYIPVYLFCIWDSYRTTVDLNNEYILAERETAPIKKTTLKSYGLNYLDKRNPLMATFWSLTVPSVGQIYQHRILQGFFTLLWAILIIYYSHFVEAMHYLYLGDIKKSTSVLNIQWLMFFPSFYFFTIYDAYMNTVELNKLFKKEQKDYLKKHFQPSDFKVIKGKKVT
ncbi:hypothetical protein [Bacillus sp. ISL-7]|uniref:hypothetical protein n=1 Tax=Bacillus sp. ISL-7 TaxID=2819136 RepID=UPI001BE912BC|nr:hypothetical protein [Bacillus sp. ISL-7]MBT2734779.1 hypothetical protein [Bacillus sp. ISL-7]